VNLSHAPAPADRSNNAEAGRLRRADSELHDDRPRDRAGAAATVQFGVEKVAMTSMPRHLGAPDGRPASSR
jgi:hypothetical protein